MLQPFKNYVSIVIPVPTGISPKSSKASSFPFGWCSATNQNLHSKRKMKHRLLRTSQWRIFHRSSLRSSVRAWEAICVLLKPYSMVRVITDHNHNVNSFVSWRHNYYLEDENLRINYRMKPSLRLPRRSLCLWFTEISPLADSVEMTKIFLSNTCSDDTNRGGETMWILQITKIVNKNNFVLIDCFYCISIGFIGVKAR